MDKAIGCGVLIALWFLLTMCAGVSYLGDDSDDCYRTPGAQPGSAQYERDTQRCLEP